VAAAVAVVAAAVLHRLRDRFDASPAPSLFTDFVNRSTS
jgi:hypothetical protein